tara:strand:+ start:147 stop:851 length:705 start_codon:yes stop_codon:yes gene_type:complete
MENSPVFWNIQGKILYDTERSFFDYETSMSVNWNNKLARKVLLTIMRLFNRPSILDIKTNGVAIWTYMNLKNAIFYKLPIIFNEIVLRDEYLYTKNNLLFLTVSYHLVLDEAYINSLNNYHNYISYDSNKMMLYVKSRTLEENLVILNVFLNNNKLPKKNIGNRIKNEMILLNKKSEKEFVNVMKTYINSINNRTNIIKLPKYINNNTSQNIINSNEEEQEEQEEQEEHDLDSE